MTITLDTLTLPDELVWMDELGWSPVKSSFAYTIQGRMILNSNKVLGDSGRPITLNGDFGFMTRTNLMILKSFADTLGKIMTLTLHSGSSYSVIFRHWDSPVIEPEPLVRTAYPDTNTLYTLTLKLAVIQ